MREFIERIIDRACSRILDEMADSGGSLSPSSTISDAENGVVVIQVSPPPPAYKRDKETLVRVFTRLRSGSRSPVRLTGLSRFLKLPPELQLQVISYLNFGDIERLRRTCRVMRGGIPKPLIRSLFPDLKMALLGTCYECLSHQPTRAHLIRADENEHRYPLSSKCFSCIARKGEFKVGTKYIIGNYTTAWVCRWCGMPIISTAAWNQPEFHRRCYRVYNKILLLYFLAGCAQWVVVVIAYALTSAYFRQYAMVLGPTTVSFVFLITGISDNLQINLIMAFWAFSLTVLRGPSIRTYHWAFLVELAILALWIPPVYSISRHMADHSSRSTDVTLAFIGFNM